jgi:hypothetical protein
MSGTVRLTTGATDGSATGSSTLAAGDTISREVDLNNVNATTAKRGIILRFFARRSSLLDTDPRNGLQVHIQACPKAWKRTVTGLAPPAFQYKCTPGATAVIINGVPSTSVSQLESAGGALIPLNSQNARGRDFLVMTLTLPATAPGDLGKMAACSGTAGGTPATENLQGCSSTLTYTYQATYTTGA